MSQLEDKLPFFNMGPTLIQITETTKEADNIQHKDSTKTRKKYKFRLKNYNLVLISVIVSFLVGFATGVVLVGTAEKDPENNVRTKPVYMSSRTLNSIEEKPETKTYNSVSFTGEEQKLKDIYPKGMTEVMKNILKDDTHKAHIELKQTPNKHTVLYDNIYWGSEVENSLPKGYDDEAARIWEDYLKQAEVAKIEIGCGRMQNRLVTFKDGMQACVRYRQNTDQIQGEIFSFYVGRLLKLNNLAPSAVKIIDNKDNLWKNVANSLASAQWANNHAVVLTQYIPSLESATIPNVFKPASRHLNKFDVYKMISKENGTVSNLIMEKLKLKKDKEVKDTDFKQLDLILNEKTKELFVELAQWSDLIIFDYLTANLDRIVNNLFNYQWNVNIMDGPAHNLAKKIDNGLLLFLDNESGLLHGYRLLKKYNSYHSLMLDNLCVFRKSTVDILKTVYEHKNIGAIISEVFHKKNNAVVRDILPQLPEKNVKILHERIGRVLSQVTKCEREFSLR